jgi:dTDP-4-amino-4,6-dideoxygalactose transaminase
LIEKAKQLREGGHQAALQEETEGRNSRLDEIQAALLRLKLPYLERWNLRRRYLAVIYEQRLSLAPNLQLPRSVAHEAHVHHLYVVQHANRDGLRAHLSARGIESIIHYPFLLHQQPLFNARTQASLPVAEQAGRQILSLPLYPQMTEVEVHEVADAVLQFVEDDRVQKQRSTTSQDLSGKSRCPIS